MAWVATAVGGAALVGGLISSDASRSAANKQSDAAKSASDATLQQFNTVNNQQLPYRQAGYSALSELNNRLGLTAQAPAQTKDYFDEAAYIAANPDVAQKWKGGSAWDHYNMYGRKEGRAFTGTPEYQQALNQHDTGSSMPGFGSFSHEFNAADLNANLAPNYDFMLKQGQGQTANTLNSTGGLLSGNAQQGLNTFTQNYAKNAYQDAFNNYTTNQTNIYNRLASLAGLGQTSIQNSGTAGANAVGQSTGYLTSGAAAEAAGTVGQANALSSGAQGIGNGVLLSSLLKK